MSTWHQQRNPVQLWHETKWTVVTDPPNQTMSVERFDSKEKALEAQTRTLHSYALPPGGIR